MNSSPSKPSASKGIRILIALIVVIGLAFLPATTRASSFTVNSANDAVDANPGDGVCQDAAGQCTLRAAIQETNALAGSDTITLPAGTYSLSLSGPYEQAGASGDLNISDDLIISGAGAASTAIDASTLAAPDRVFKMDQGTVVEINNVTITGGEAADSSGGGILNERGQLTLNDVTISNNQAASGGGGVENFEGTLTITGSVFTSNTAGIYGFGGAISSSGDLSITNSDFSGNTSGRGGGGIWNFGSTTITDSTISGNTAVEGGGGIQNVGHAHTLQITRCIITNNQALEGGGLDTTSTTLIADSEITLNTSTRDGGGGISSLETMTITGSTINGNTAAGSEWSPGGGINSRGGGLIIMDSDLSNNQAVTNGVNRWASGGAISSYQEDVQIINSTLSGNQADFGGAIWFEGSTATITDSALTGNLANSTGGGIRIGRSGTLEIRSSTLSANQATGCGGFIAIINDGNTVVIRDSAIEANSGGCGGGLLNGQTSSLTLIRSSVHGNTTSTGNGGGIYNDGILSINSSTVSANTTGGYGGGLLSWTHAETAINNSTISGNSAVTEGGGIFNRSILTLNSSTLAGNAAADGSGLYNFSDGTATFSNTIVAQNPGSADCEGGTLVSNGYNLESGTSCSFTSSGDLQNVLPLLGPLGDNGGPTQTHALQVGSPAIDAGNPALPGSAGGSCELTDQRGAPRLQGIACDIGAYESGNVLFVTSTLDAVDAAPGDGVCETASVGECTLRAAVQESNARSGQDTILLPGGTITLSLAGSGEDAAATGDLDITDDLILLGTDNTTVDGAGLDRVFSFIGSAASPILVSMEKVTIINASANFGGAIYNQTNSTLYLDQLTLSGNAALATNGGAILNNGTLTISNSTISGNSSVRSGGGINNSGTMTLNGVTITNNTADSDNDGVGQGGGIVISPTGAASISNTIVAGNINTGIARPDCGGSGSVVSNGYNLIGNDTGCNFTSGAGDQVGTSASPIDPALAPLADYGGGALTHTLLAGSPAIDAGSPAVPGSGGGACEEIDQRGLARPLGSVCDIGAVEVENTPIGTGVLVTPVDTTTGSTPVTVTFPQVDGEGTTSLETYSCAEPARPTGFKLGDPPACYDISTTADFSPPAEVCIDYSGIVFNDEASLQFFHYDESIPDWVPITPTFWDMGTNIICGLVDSFSPFGLFEPEQVNQPPEANPGGPYAVEEGGVITLTGSGSDPDGDPLTYSWDLDDDGVFESPGEEAVFSAEALDGPSAHPVNLQVCDPGGLCATAGSLVEVTNVAPLVVTSPDLELSEGSPELAVSSSFSDPGADSWTASVDYGDGQGPQPLALQTDNTFSLVHLYPSDDGVFEVTVQVLDDDGASGSSSFRVTVSNTNPSVAAGPDAQIISGEPFSIQASFTDLGLLDTHTATIDWGDGSGPTGASLIQGDGSGTVSGTRTYLLPVVYTITVCVTDDDGGSGCDSLTLDVVPLDVTIDIKPKSETNTLNCRNPNGQITLALFSNEIFSASSVDPHTIRSGPAGAIEAHQDKDGNPRVHLEDFNGDGRDDLLLHFTYGDTGLVCEDTTASLSGSTESGIYFQGSDVVSSNPRKGPKEDSYTASIWRKGLNIPAGGAAFLRLVFVNADSTKTIFTVPVTSGDYEQWEQFSNTFVAPKDYTRINVSLMFTKPSGTLWWDDISVVQGP